MIELLELKVPYALDQKQALRQLIIKKLGIDEGDLISFEIIRRSIDARKKPEIYFTYSCAVLLPEQLEKRILKKYLNPRPNKNCKGKRKTAQVKLRRYEPVTYQLPSPNKELKSNPVVVGAGPAGLFAAYILALNGLSPILIERGKDIESRTEDVEDFFLTGVLKPDSNVQFGEGGAGAFSDGKLNTQVHDKEGRNAFVLKTFVNFGADPLIMYDPKPHVGTDKLVSVVYNLRKEIVRLGGDVRFETCFLDYDESDGYLQGIWVEDLRKSSGDASNREYLPCEDLILAIGHSARDTFEMLYDKGLPMRAKQFAVGFRVEHPQEWLNLHQYGILHENLPTASYKLATNLSNGRGVYSFCMCPGGYVENSSSEDGRLVVNGMSYSKRDSKNCNSAIVVSIGEKEFDLDDPMSAIQYQRSIEKKAYDLGMGKIPQQLLGDFEENRVSTSYGEFESVTRGETTLTNLRGIFSPEIEESFLEGMRAFDRKIHGFYRPDAILSGVESRTSSPVRITRNDCGMTSIYGIYPCGEGAGYAGGIMSAAMDGMKMAEKLIARYTVE